MTQPPHDLDDGFGHWLAGFIDGEACFIVHRIGRCYACRFCVRLRADDFALMEEVHERLRLGTVSRVAVVPSARPGTRPMVEWRITNRADCLGLVAVLDRYQLRSKKARDYALWREAVLEWERQRGERSRDWSRMAALYDQIRAGRRYEADLALPV